MKRSKEQNRKQKEVDRKNNPIRNAYRYNKSKHKSGWRLTWEFFKSWCLMKGWKKKRGNSAEDYCISKRDFSQPYTEENIKLRKRREHSRKAREWRDEKHDNW